ncbi:MAG: methyltransferase domain-containing protein [Candidatus Pacebacteria bacterium]|jgi:SAM-dependent methyltransferase|nr:methyltransferase domain-containing protein [Candidatus Paceibacterota bacterium]|tara:strand:- start:7688 stop:8377 length:690 start_codon:yes stop_codon:yes gene_type:complete
MTSKIKKGAVSALYKTGLMSKMTRKNFDRHIKKYASLLRTLDVGSGGNPYKGFFPNRVSMDIVDDNDVDVVADVHDMKVFENGEFDNVLCTEALEHFCNPFKAIEEMKRVLKKDGLLILTTRFIMPLHEVPNDYFRFTEYGLKNLLKDFEIVELHEDENTIETLGVLMQRIGYQTDTLHFKPFKLFWFILSKITKLFSFVLTKQYGEINNKNEVKNIMTSGYLVICKKK